MKKYGERAFNLAMSYMRISARSRFQLTFNIKPTCILSLIIIVNVLTISVRTTTAIESVTWSENNAESIANQFHELSISIKNSASNEIASHFSDFFLATGFPRHIDNPQPINTWVSQWETRPGKSGIGKRDFLSDFRDYRAYFPEIEDVRIKVKNAHFSQQSTSTVCDALIRISIVGRNEKNQRQWAVIKIKISAKLNDNESWLIDTFNIIDYSARVARSELFSEVSVPAGTYHSAPKFGTQGNQTFSAHGVAIADINNDGWVDAFTTGIQENFLYMNQRDGTFLDRAEEVGLRFTPPATAPLFLDGDNDGDIDLFMAAVGYQMYFTNRLDEEDLPEFVDESQRAHVAYPAHSFGAVTADIDQDGWTDIYVSSYNQYGTIMPDSWSRAENGTANLLFHNQGGGSFSEEAGVRGVADRRWSYAAAFADIDEDGDQDLYVVNDFGENGFYRNERGYYVECASNMGLLDSGNGMGVSFGDFNNDGLIDLHVTNMSSTAGKRILNLLFPDSTPPKHIQVLEKLAAGNTLFENLGSGNFSDVSKVAGPFGAGWAFGGGFIDFDNDGWQDIHAPNGFISGTSLKDT